MKAFAAEKAANERASEKWLAAPRTFPVSQASRREIVCNKGQSEYQTGEKQKISQLQHKCCKKPDNEEAQSTVIDPSLAETRSHTGILNRSSGISKASPYCFRSPLSSDMHVKLR
jgi:hypothetical protein